MRDDWLPVREATRRYRVSRATLYRLIARGAVRRGKRAGDVRAYVRTGDLKKVTEIHVVPPAAAPRRRKRA